MSRLWFAADGVDTTWMETGDQCDGFRPSNADADVFFAVSDASTWEPGRVYDCPQGYRWMSTAEANATWPIHHGMPQGEEEGSGEDADHVYFDRCGWNGYVHDGRERLRFRFSDSATTGGFKHAGVVVYHAHRGRLAVG